MTNIKRSVFGVFLALSLITAASAQEQKVLDAATFSTHLSRPAVQLLDVRTAAEFKDGHIKNALQADWTNRSQFTDRTRHLDKSKPVYVYCLSGGRSSDAATRLRTDGYQVYELQGGILSWKKNKLPLEGASSRRQMTKEEYTASTQTAGTVLVDFGADWCPPCKKMEPILAEVQKEKAGAFSFVKVDGGIDTDVMKAQKVEALPVFIIYKNGKEVWRKEGIVSKEELLRNL
jgi:rhodanese-related sulfurtransferase